MRQWWARSWAGIFVFLAAPATVGAQSGAGAQAFADRLEDGGHALQDARDPVWGASPVQDPDGRTHLFVARWPRESGHDGMPRSLYLASGTNRDGGPVSVNDVFRSTDL